jgi:hypothetical protein
MPFGPESEAYDAIAIAESALRDLIESVLNLRSDDDWYARSGVAAVRLDAWKARRSQDAQQRGGSLAKPLLIDHSELHDLVDVITKHWTEFKPCFGDMKETELFLKRLGDFRNPTMHSRGLLPFERALAIGISGQLRNQMTIYRSSGPNKEYFPRIEYLGDSLGHSVTGEVSQGGGVQAHLFTGMTLRVGQEIEYEAHAWDPEGAAIAYTVWIVRNEAFEIPPDEGPVRFRWRVTHSDVGEHVGVNVSDPCRTRLPPNERRLG